MKEQALALTTAVDDHRHGEYRSNNQQPKTKNQKLKTKN